MRTFRVLAPVFFFLFLNADSFGQPGQQATRPEPYRIGIFPAAGNFGVANRSTQEERSAHILRARVQAQEAFALTYSYYHEDLRGPQIARRDRVWADDVIRKEPKLSEVKKFARERGLDGVVMAWGDTGEGWIAAREGDRGTNPVFIYMVDIERDRMYVRKGAFDDVSHMAEQVFTDFLKGRPQIARAQVFSSVAEQTPVPASQPPKTMQPAGQIKQPAGAVSPAAPYRIAILPASGCFASDGSFGCGWIGEKETAQALAARINTDDSLVLAFSFYDQTLNTPPIQNRSQLWTGGETHGRPNLQAVYALSQERKFDAALIYWGGGNPAGGNVPTRAVPIELHLIDVIRRQSRKYEAMSDDVYRVADRLFTDFMGERSKVVQAQTPAAVAQPKATPVQAKAEPLVVPAASPTAPPPGQDISRVATTGDQEYKQRGIYEPVSLHDRERHLIEDANEIEGQFVRRGLRYQNPVLEGWLSRIAAKVTPAPTDPYIKYRVFLLRDPSPNAFALPDGQIYVHTGMLARLGNESQLAALLAHEVNHTAGHHGILHYRSVRKKAIASVVVGATLGGAVSGIVNVSLSASVFGYSRGLETEADMRAIELVRKAGFDVHEMPRMFEIMNQDPEGLEPRMSSKWSTHPQLEDRASYIRRAIAEVPKGTGGPGSQESFEALLVPITLMTIRDYIGADYPRTALALARRLAQRYPNDPRALAALGDAWQALGARSELAADQPLTDEQKRANIKERARLTRVERETKQLESAQGRANMAENLARARQAYLDALNLGHSVPEAYRELGGVYAKLEMHEDAARAYMEYLKAKPEATDKPLVLEQLKVLVSKIKAVKGGVE